MDNHTTLFANICEWLWKPRVTLFIGVIKDVCIWANATVKKLERFLSTNIDRSGNRSSQDDFAEGEEDGDGMHTHAIMVRKREERLAQFKELMAGSIAACTLLNYCTIGTLTLPLSPATPPEGTSLNYLFSQCFTCLLSYSVCMYVGRTTAKAQEDERKSQPTPLYCEECRLVASASASTLLRCSRCRNVWYCSKQHQAKHWKTHKVRVRIITLFDPYYSHY